MYFEKLEITNYRCFETETVTFEPGVTVIHGRNGAGKTTLLEACFFALYGSDALREGDSNLEDILTTDKDTTTVELRFRHNDDEYTVTREVRRRGDRVTQSVCELQTPSESLSGATQVDSEIQEMVRMDASAFLNCAYVRQGEIEKLIRATPDERQDLLDNLLQIGRLETYKERASDIRVGVKRVRDRKRELREDRKDMIQERESSKPFERLEALNNELRLLQDRLSSLKSKRDRLSDERDLAQQTVKKQKEIKEDVADIDQEITVVQDTVDSLKDDRESLESEIDQKSEELRSKNTKFKRELESADVSLDVGESTGTDALESIHDELVELRGTTGEDIATKKGRVSNLQAERDRLEDDIQTAKNTLNEKNNTIDTLQTKLESELRPEYNSLENNLTEHENHITELQEKLEDTDIDPDDIRDERLRLETKREELVEERTSISGDRKATQTELDRAKELKDNGKCPECGQDVSDAPHVNRITELQEKVESHTEQYEEIGAEIQSVDNELDEISSLEDIADELHDVTQKKQNTKQLIEKQDVAISDVEEQITECRQEIEQKETEIVDLEDKVESARNKLNGMKDVVEELQQEKETFEEKIAVVDRLLSIRESEADLETEINDHKKDIEHKGELLEQKQNQLETLEEQRETLISDIDEDAFETVMVRVDAIKSDIDTLETKIESVEDTVGDKQQLKGQVRNSIERLEELRDEKEAFAEEIESLQELYEQMEDVEGMYTALRRDLRQENIEKLEQLLNQLFDLTYQNNSYSRIDLDGKYQATVIEKGGIELEPKKLSGGESALFNLSLRCAIYELLAEALGGGSLMPPLILDEPTIHLDKGHVARIDGMVRRMRDNGVEQTIVVSHDDEVIDSANHRIHVEQTSSSSNRSTATEESQMLM